MQFERATDIEKLGRKIIRALNLSHIKPERVRYLRSRESKSRSYARIWTFPKVFQLTLKIPPAYVIEVLSQHFDKLQKGEQEKILIHELLHIPKNFSGALLPHRSRGRRLHKLVNELYEKYRLKS